MLGHAFADFEREVEAGKAGIALLKFLNDAKSVEVVVEAVAETAHLAVQLVLAGMREGRVADVVDQGQRLGEILVESKHGSDSAGDLRDLDGVGQAVAEMVGESGREHLGFGFKTAEGARVDDAVAVALERVAVRVLRFRI